MKMAQLRFFISLLKKRRTQWQLFAGLCFAALFSQSLVVQTKYEHLEVSEPVMIPTTSASEKSSQNLPFVTSSNPRFDLNNHSQQSLPAQHFQSDAAKSSERSYDNDRIVESHDDEPPSIGHRKSHKFKSILMNAGLDKKSVFNNVEDSESPPRSSELSRKVVNKASFEQDHRKDGPYKDDLKLRTDKHDSKHKLWKAKTKERFSKSPSPKNSSNGLSIFKQLAGVALAGSSLLKTSDDQSTSGTASKYLELFSNVMQSGVLNGHGKSSPDKQDQGSGMLQYLPMLTQLMSKSSEGHDNGEGRGSLTSFAPLAASGLMTLLNGKSGQDSTSGMMTSLMAASGMFGSYSPLVNTFTSDFSAHRMPRTVTKPHTDSYLNGLIRVEDDHILNMKPLVSSALTFLGLLGPNDFEEMQNDSTSVSSVLKSIFYIWNPRASHWATHASKYFREQTVKLGEHGDKFTKQKGAKKIEFPLEYCNCTRTLTVPKTRIGTGSLRNNTCGKDSFNRGPGQKIIGFSFYGDPNSTKSKSRKYFQGIEDNLALVPEFYPGWTVRVYFDLDEEDPLRGDLCRLACNNPNIDMCYVKNIPAQKDISKVFAMIWRFFPVVDPQVDLYVSRDLDSRLNAREAAAVAEWRKTNKHFHFMRDHPAHGIEILGSGWGVSLGPAGSLVRRLMFQALQEGSQDPLFWAERNAYGPDQGFLKRFFWPWGKWSAISHDSYTCQHFPRTQPFPTRREEETENNFIASVVEAHDVMRQECPIECRPKEHLNWLLC